MIVDSFNANDEVDLAIFRIRYLWHLVDKFVIGEANITHSGSRKSAKFSHLFEGTPFEEKVEVVKLDIALADDPFSRDILQRELLVSWVTNKYPNSHYINSDLDEIPSHAQLQESTRFIETFHFLTPTYFRFANWAALDSHSKWSRGIISHSSLPVRKNGGRFDKNVKYLVDDPGLHLSYVGRNWQQIASKFSDFAHQELNFEIIKSKAFLDYCNLHAIDHLGRFDTNSFGLLKVLTHQELTPMHNFLLESHKEFFDFRISGPRSKRLLASLVVSSIFFYKGNWKREVISDAFIKRGDSPTFLLIATLLLCYSFARLLVRRFINSR